MLYNGWPVLVKSFTILSSEERTSKSLIIRMEIIRPIKMMSLSRSRCSTRKLIQNGSSSPVSKLRLDFEDLCTASPQGMPLQSYQKSLVFSPIEHDVSPLPKERTPRNLAADFCCTSSDEEKQPEMDSDEDSRDSGFSSCEESSSPVFNVLPQSTKRSLCYESSAEDSSDDDFDMGVGLLKTPLSRPKSACFNFNTSFSEANDDSLFKLRSRRRLFGDCDDSNDVTDVLSSPVLTKRQKNSSKVLLDEAQPSATVTQANIMSALEKEDDWEDLTGDFSRSHCLPTVSGKHKDLKAISPQTLSKVLQGEFDHQVERMIIVDCRYPFEFQGGHIQSARNMYTKEEVKREFIDSTLHRSSTSQEKRTIIVFHCEFSSERGPRMLRFLRDQDRAANAHQYPSLFYPELYLLEGGYKAFYESMAGDLCEPQGYTLMLDNDYAEELKYFRARSKTLPGARPQKHRRRGLKL